MSTPKGPDDFDDIDVREDQTPDKPGSGDEEPCTLKNPTPACELPPQTPACGNQPPKPTDKH